PPAPGAPGRGGPPHRRGGRARKPALRVGGPHAATLGLHGFLAALREVPRLVHHPAALAAHAERARLAGVPRAEPAVERDEAAGLAALAEYVAYGREAAAGADARGRHAGPRLGDAGQDCNAARGQPAAAS